ncbi:MAG TPA: hypothetical protein VF475_11170 [Sphingobium sp.]
MRFSKGSYGFALCVLSGVLWTQAASGQEMPVEAINAASIVDIPFILGDTPIGQADASLWVKGDRPANPLLASVSIKPVQAATVKAGAGDAILWRAFAGGGITVLNSNDLDLGSRPIFCGIVPDRPVLSCFIDENADGRFDQVAQAKAERGAKPYHATIMRGAQPLPTPIPYAIVADDKRPSLTVELRNCAKDYDRPRFTALSTSDRDIPVSSAVFGWHAKDSSFAGCRRGLQRPSTPDTATVPPGGYLGEIGPLLFSVGPKGNPRVALVGPARSDGLYRLEGANLVSMSIGHTPAQAQLIALKKFPYPVLMTDEGATIRQGPIAVNGTLASIPFHHAYRGRLTQDLSISTLFGKRSLPMGTILYGFPAQSRLTRTINGIPDLESVDDDTYRTVKLELTWCAPVRGPEPEKPKAGVIARSGWSAACVPYSNMGNHTIITDRTPAFSIMGVSYDATTSSNDGLPPIRRDDGATFERPLRVDYVYEGREGESISLAEQIYFGDELTSVKPLKLYAPDGKMNAIIAGAPVAISVDANGALTLVTVKPPVTGLNPLLKWDERALLLQQLQKMGLKPAGDWQPGGAIPVEREK